MQRQRNRAAVAVAVVAAILGSAVAHGATMRPHRESAKLPRALVATWTRRITAAELARFGIQSTPDCVDVLTIAGNGDVTLRGTRCKAPVDATVYTAKMTQVRPGVIRIDFGAGITPPTVAWKVSGDLLLVKALSAAFNGDRVLWTGTWHRR